jgi:hypothetical protein
MEAAKTQRGLAAPSSSPMTVGDSVNVPQQGPYTHPSPPAPPSSPLPLQTGDYSPWCEPVDRAFKNVVFLPPSPVGTPKFTTLERPYVAEGNMDWVVQRVLSSSTPDKSGDNGNSSYLSEDKIQRLNFLSLLRATITVDITVRPVLVFIGNCADSKLIIRGIISLCCFSCADGMCETASDFHVIDTNGCYSKDCRTCSLRREYAGSIKQPNLYKKTDLAVRIAIELSRFNLIN